MICKFVSVYILSKTTKIVNIFEYRHTEYIPIDTYYVLVCFAEYSFFCTGGCHGNALKIKIKFAKKVRVMRSVTDVVQVIICTVLNFE